VQREGLMVLQARPEAAELRYDRSAPTRGGRTPFAEGIVALLWIALIVLLVPVVIFLVGLPIAALLRLMVEVGAWIFALPG
jgi:hypothetical protein